MEFECIPLGSGIGPAVYWMTGAEFSPDKLLAELADCDGILVVCRLSDWNRHMTPWEAPPAFGREGFSGGAGETLHWLRETCIPAVTAQYGQREGYVCGYSLGGLFALWAVLECDCFRGAASCSGSLWYPGWLDYFRSKSISREIRVYLSLGTHEERTHNPVLAAVGPATRETYERLQQHCPAALQWNPGGHFRDPERRTAMGIRWLLGKEML